MRLRVTRRILAGVLFLSSLSLQTRAQDMTGIWRGYFITEGHDQYKFEIQIKQNPQKTVTGVSYSYLTTVFYGKATLTGHYNPATKKVLIQEIKTVELRMSGGSVACIMKCLMEYSRSGKEEFLEGTYTSKIEKTGYGNKRGDDCGGGRVYLRKVQTSDFYVEPFLRDKPGERKPSLATTKPKTTPKTTTPSQKPVAKAPAKTPPSSKTSTGTTPGTKTATKPRVDTVKKITAPPVVKSEPKIEKPKPITLPSTTRSRQNELLQTLVIENEDVTVRLYDNGEIDDDTISVYLDNRLVLSQKRLTAAPLTLSLKMDESNPEHVLVMVAENLGRIPPNTSLMIVTDGVKRYQVRITSTDQKNAMVRFRYEKRDDR